ncbi:hypothetical protein ACLQ2R_17545 [Streptosporangium sp. DT93]|uniref:hypothetical protein n=1 Tax=Streptosporangium sp. DT93 TaxID=3393428 RepID=UPI003CE6CFA3
MSREPIGLLARWASLLANPDMERRSYWWLLADSKNWALILITRGKPGEPPEPPQQQPAPRMSPEWLRRTGGNLTPEELLHERIGQHLRAHVQHDTEVDVARAASIATTAAVEALAELGVDVSTLTRGDEQEGTR